MPNAKGMRTQHMDTFRIETFGIIKIDRKHKSCNAHCSCRTPHCDHRTETMPECRMNRKGHKKPVAFLVQWLRQGHCFSSHEEHLESQGIITTADELTCRHWLLDPAQKDLRPLLELEAKWSGSTLVFD